MLGADVDVSATYRGYRKQALYVLARVLTDNEAESRTYVPEGNSENWFGSLQSATQRRSWMCHNEERERLLL